MTSTPKKRLRHVKSITIDPELEREVAQFAKDNSVRISQVYEAGARLIIARGDTSLAPPLSTHQEAALRAASQGPVRSRDVGLGRLGASQAFRTLMRRGWALRSARGVYEATDAGREVLEKIDRTQGKEGDRS